MSVLDIVTSPWVITPEKLLEIRQIYETRLRGESIDIAAAEARLGRPMQGGSARRDYVVEDGVAIISVEGVIAPKANLFMQISGGASAQVLQRQLSTAANDPIVRAILLDIDSPGGSAFGVPEVGALVREIRDVMPIAAWTAGQMTSGAYWIGAAADSVWISSGVAVLGSIGVVATHVDVSGRERSQGVKTTEITAGRYKRISSQYGPLTDEGRADLQAQVDAIYEVFVETIARNRGVDVDTVLDRMADGRVFVGRHAVESGLADGAMSRAEILNRLASGERLAAKPVPAIRVGDPSITTEQSMTTANTPPVSAPVPAIAAVLTVETVKQSAPTVAQALIDEGRTAGASAERDRILAIDAAAMPGYEAIVAEAKKDGTSTAGDVALRIHGEMRREGADRLQQIREQAPQPAPAAAAPVESAAKGGAAQGEPNAHEIARRAQVHQTEQRAQGRNISTAEAVREVMAQPAA